MDRIAQALHACLMYAELEELKELAASINALRKSDPRFYNIQSRKSLFVAMTEALDIAYDELGWKDIEQEQP